MEREFKLLEKITLETYKTLIFLFIYLLAEKEKNRLNVTDV